MRAGGNADLKLASLKSPLVFWRLGGATMGYPAPLPSLINNNWQPPLRRRVEAFPQHLDVIWHRANGCYCFSDNVNNNTNLGWDLHITSVNRLMYWKHTQHNIVQARFENLYSVTCLYDLSLRPSKRVGGRTSAIFDENCWMYHTKKRPGEGFWRNLWISKMCWCI